MLDKSLHIKAYICMALTSITLTSLSAVVWANEASDLKLSVGVDYTSGDYGGDEDIKDIYIPVTAVYDTGSLGFRLTIPYLRVRAPSGTIITESGGQTFVGTGPTTTESGLGDVIGGITLYDLVNSFELGIAMDVTAQVKFGTADENEGLGTGENDYSIRTDVYKYFDDFNLMGSVGYKVRDDPSGLDLEDAWFVSIGGVYEFKAKTRGGIVYDYRQSAFDSGDPVRELTGFVSFPLNDSWRIQVYGLTGFSDSSPDWGSGVILTLKM